MFSWFAVVTWLVVIQLALGVDALNDDAVGSELLVGQVRNLSASLVNYEELLDGETVLKLNVSWLPPENGRTPSFYSVLLTSFGANSTTKDQDNDHQVNKDLSSCVEGSIYYVGQDVNETHVLLPENRFGAADGTAFELDIEPGCSYTVQVFANPRNNLLANDSPSIVFTVPECVGSRCNCDRALEELPIPTVSAKSLPNGSTLISWKIEASSSNREVKSYRVSVGIPHLMSSSGLVIYNKTQIFNGPTDIDSFDWYHEKLRKGTKIFVSATDAYGCSSKEGSYMVMRPRPHPFYRKNATAIVFAGLVVLCLMISGICSFIRYLSRNHHYKLVSLKQKSTRRITSVITTQRIESLLKNHNILYVEQEIEDARRKDLVDEHELSYSRLSIVRELGQGQFGKVYLANLLRHAGGGGNGNSNDEDNTGYYVAVKMSLTSSDCTRAQLEVRQQLLEEIAITKVAGSHPHLVGLVGCCTLPENPVCLVLEYMRGGDLLGYLHRMRDAVDASSAGNDVSSLENTGLSSVAETTCTNLGSQSPSMPTSRVFFPSDIKPENLANFETEAAISHTKMMRFALEIAKGMEHLEAKGIVHRDLAARNVLMDENLVLKISDFGLSRKGTYTLGGPGIRRLPIRWMSPEAIRRRAFTSKSDVWSYGVLLWEIASLGDFPYPRHSDDELLRHLLVEDGRPEVAASVPSDMREMMGMCWTGRANRRPTFQQIVLWLESRKDILCKNNPAYQVVPQQDSF